MSSGEPQPCCSKSLASSGFDEMEIDEGESFGFSGRSAGFQAGTSSSSMPEVLVSPSAKEGAPPKKNLGTRRKEKLSKSEQEKQAAIRQGVQRLMAECHDLGEVKELLLSAIADMDDEIEFVMQMTALSKEACKMLLTLDQFDDADLDGSEDDGDADAFTNQLLELEYASLSPQQQAQEQRDSSATSAILTELLQQQYSAAEIPDPELVNEILDD